MNNHHVISRIEREGEDGIVVGGYAHAPGMSLTWQSGPMTDGVPTGATIEGVIVAALDRLRAFQSSPLMCQENAETIEHLEAALASQERRTAGRKARGVEGTYAN